MGEIGVPAFGERAEAAPTNGGVPLNSTRGVTTWREPGRRFRSSTGRHGEADRAALVRQGIAALFRAVAFGERGRVEFLGGRAARQKRPALAAHQKRIDRLTNTYSRVLNKLAKCCSM